MGGEVWVVVLVEENGCCSKKKKRVEGLKKSRGAVWSAFGFLSGSLAGLSVMRGILLLLSACPFHLSGELFSLSLDCVQTSRLHVAGPKSWVGKESRDFFFFCLLCWPDFFLFLFCT